MNSPENKVPEEVLWELDTLYNEAMEEQAKNQLVYEAIEKALGRVANRFYPYISHWQPEDMHKLADEISRIALDFCLKLGNMDYRRGDNSED